MPPPYIGEIRSETEKQECRTHQVLALSNPGYRLNVERMHGKQDPSKEARQGCLRGGAPPQEHQHRVERMDGHIDDMKCARIQSKEADVDHVRQPCQWVPVRRVPSRQCPAKPGPRQARSYLRIVDNVRGIVPVDE